MAPARALILAMAAVLATTLGARSIEAVSSTASATFPASSAALDITSTIDSTTLSVYIAPSAHATGGTSFDHAFLADHCNIDIHILQNLTNFSMESAGDNNNITITNCNAEPIPTTASVTFPITFAGPQPAFGGSNKLAAAFSRYEFSTAFKLGFSAAVALAGCTTAAPVYTNPTFTYLPADAPTQVIVSFDYPLTAGYIPPGSALINGNAVGNVLVEPSVWFGRLDPALKYSKVLKHYIFGNGTAGGGSFGSPTTSPTTCLCPTTPPGTCPGAGRAATCPRGGCAASDAPPPSSAVTGAWDITATLGGALFSLDITPAAHAADGTSFSLTNIADHCNVNIHILQNLTNFNLDNAGDENNITIIHCS